MMYGSAGIPLRTFLTGYLQWLSLSIFSVRSSWFCCIGFSVCNFTRLMTLSNTSEASLTKIQQHNVHSIFVSFFPFKRHSNQHRAILKLSSFWLLRSDGASSGGGMFCQTDGKASLCCTHTDTHTFLLMISRPALTFSHSLQSELMCQSCSFPLKTDVAGTSN